MSKYVDTRHQVAATSRDGNKQGILGADTDSAEPTDSVDTVSSLTDALDSTTGISYFVVAS